MKICNNKHDHFVRLKRGFYLKHIYRGQPCAIKLENVQPKLFLVILQNPT